ncbi:chalcone isomerase [Spizellomyces sp. 'palustris']|nr:chalcone isomerase [Spizellomyces sp. 'palustris']
MRPPRIPVPSFRPIRSTGLFVLRARSHSTSLPYRARRISPSWIAIGAGVGVGVCLLGWRGVVLAEKLEQDNSVVLEPASKKPIPKTLVLTYATLPKPHTLHLLGLGIRQVTFLNINVYTIGFYVGQEALDRVRMGEVWEGFEGRALEGFVERLVEGDVAVRIEPVRDTDGPHLRNGLMRMLTSRLTTSSLNESQRQEILAHMDNFRAAFPSGRIRKGEEFIFVKTKEGLRVFFEGTELVLIPSPWIAQMFMEGYLREKKAISPKLRQSVSKGLEDLVMVKVAN